MKRIVRIGTRESKLALAQTNLVMDKIRSKHPEIEFDILKVKTKGDIFLDKRLDQIGGKGLFVSELEKLILDGKIDIAVHSMKDMPTELDHGLMIAAVSEREDPRDVLVTNKFERLSDMREGAVIGTSSIRREVEILSRRPDMSVKPVRGNILTRLEKLDSGEYDGLILAAAGLSRLDILDGRYEFFDVDDLIPAVGQGIMCVESRSDADIDFLLDSIHSLDSAFMLMAERTFLKEMNGGCSVPVAAHGVINGDELTLYGMNGIGENIVKKSVSGKKDDAMELGNLLASQLR